MTRGGWHTAWLAMSAVAAPAAAADRDYQGEDAGCLIYSVGTIRIGLKFTFPYGRIALPSGAPVKDWTGEIAPHIGGAFVLKVKNPDFEGEETGHVVVRCLPPGTYNIAGYQFGGFVPGVASYDWRPDKPLDMPFHIRAGEATYVGSFMRGQSLGTSLQPVLGAVGYFVVANRAGRDLPLATGRLPAAMKIRVEVTDVATFHTPMLQTNEPR